VNSLATAFHLGIQADFPFTIYHFSFFIVLEDKRARLFLPFLYERDLLVKGILDGVNEIGFLSSMANGEW